MLVPIKIAAGRRSVLVPAFLQQLDLGWRGDAKPPQSAAINLKKHGVPFEEALTALADPNAIEAPDLADAARRITIGGLLRGVWVDLGK
jgi:hypothetical protein